MYTYIYMYSTYVLEIPKGASSLSSHESIRNALCIQASTLYTNTSMRACIYMYSTYVLEIPKGASSLSSHERRKRAMLKTASGVSAVKGSSVYLRKKK